MIFEYKTITIDGTPDAILNREAVHGWRLIAATANGSFNTLWLERERKRELAKGRQKIADRPTQEDGGVYG